MKMDARNIAQRYAISSFCVKLGDSATKTYGKLRQAFGDDAMSKAQAFRWQKKNVFLKAESLMKMSSAADDHQQHGQVTTQRGYENLFDLTED